MQEVNVQVAVRVRPLLQKEVLAGESSCVKIYPATNQIVLPRDRSYTFDHVFAQKTTQIDLYKKCIDPLVRNFLEGYNVTVFAYGQTGSGKTFTIDGGSLLNETSEGLGMMPQAVLQIYNTIQNDPSRDYTVKVSYFEIYKEELRDLMEYNSDKTLCIREDDKGNITIVGATEVVCHTAEDVMQHLRRGSSYRHTGSTLMNDRSSRSHAVFTVSLGQTWADDDSSSQRTRGQIEEEDEDERGQVEHYMGAKFHFVDLAGSERVQKTGNVGERFKESVHINTGLLALGNVISALGDPKRKVVHIPYRDSKITRILKDSLGGNARTLMICCVSPAASSLDESLNSLKFANRARNIRNKPVVNRDPQSIRFEEMQVEIKALRAELQRQRTSIVSSRAGTELGREDSHDDVTEQYKQIQEQLTRIQTDCSHYQTILEEAIEQLVELRDRGSLTESQECRLSDWLDLLEEMKNCVPATFENSMWENQTIKRLERELHQCKRDLRSDEEIFSEKTRELTAAQYRLSEMSGENERLRSRLSEMEYSHANIESQLLAKQIELDKLNARVQELETTREALELDLYSDLRNADTATSAPAEDKRRPRAVSVPSHALGNRAATGRQKPEFEDQLSVLAARNIHTSPAAITVDRVLHSFRARSRLLASQLEDEDDVIVKSFNEYDDDEGGENGEGDGDRSERGVDLGSDSELADGQFRRSDVFRGTYRVAKPGINRPKISPNICRSTPDISEQIGDDQTRGNALEENKLFVKATLARVSRQRGTQVLKIGPDSAAVDDFQLNKAELSVRQSTAQLNELTLKIKMKEQLVRDLVRQNNETERMNEANMNKIRALEAEKVAAQDQLLTLQRATKDLKQQERARNEQLQAEYRKRAEVAVANIQQLKKKQKSTRNAEIDQRIEELKTEVESLKKQESDFLRENARLEKELHEERDRVRQLEMNGEKRNDQLQAKINEMMSLQHGRSLSGVSSPSMEQQRLEEKGRWLDEEMEALLAQRQAAERLDKELEAREEMLRRKEQMLTEKSELVMKKLRSSQVVEKDMLHLSTKLYSVDERIEEKSRELVVTPREGQGHLRGEMERLQQGREKISEEYKLLNARLQDGGLLSPMDERRLIEMEEAIEALDAAIEYKNDSIAQQESELRRSRAAPPMTGRTGGATDTAASGDANSTVYNRLQNLTTAEARSLLKRYFDKAVSLRNDQRQSEKSCAELQMRVEEQAKSIRELETSLSVATEDFERRLAKQKSSFVHEIDLLTKQIELSDLTHRPISDNPTKERQIKITELEKELYYYKKTSRDLKKKLKDLTSLMVRSSNNHEGNGMQENIQSRVVDQSDAFRTDSSQVREVVGNQPATDPVNRQPIAREINNGRHPKTGKNPNPPVPDGESNNDPPTPRPNSSEVISNLPHSKNRSQKQTDSRKMGDSASAGGTIHRSSSPVKRQIPSGSLGRPAGMVTSQEERSENINNHCPTADSISSRIRADESLVNSARSGLVAEPTPPSGGRDRQTRREPRLRGTVEPVAVKQSRSDCVSIKDGRYRSDLHETLVDSLEDGR